MGSTKPQRVASAPSLSGYTPRNTIPVAPEDGDAPITDRFNEEWIPKLYAEEDDGTNTDKTGLLVPTNVRSAQRATLMVLAGSAAGKVYPIETDRFSIGRVRTSTLALADTGISRNHCTITRDTAGRYFIEDAGSTNGTLVNGQRVQRIELRTGDRIQIGAEIVFQFGFFDAAEEDLVNKLYESATRDPLTKALNRRAFQERLLAEVSYATRHRDPLIAVLLDIDHFKLVNDTHGHGGGDVVLSSVAQAIATTLRTEDVFGRYGGEEFVLLGRGLSLADGFKLAERIRLLVAAMEFQVGQLRFRITISAGVAELAEATEKVDAPGEALLSLADHRLYEAKRGGRNRIVAK
jgi:diguanylate cyclase (GGDEF)-like protein